MTIAVLFVDDEPRLLDAIQRQMRAVRFEWDASAAVGGPAALAMMEQKNFDCVISDMRMPQMDGAEFLSRVRTRWPHVSRILLSGQSDVGAAVRAAPLVHQFLSKPCASDVLLSTVAMTRRALAPLEEGTRARLACLGVLPSAPATCDKLRELLSVDEPNLDDVSYVITNDVAMSVKSMQLVSSAFFGACGVASVDAAVRTLGASLLRTLAPVAFGSDGWRADVAQLASDATLEERTGWLLQTMLGIGTNENPKLLARGLLGLWGVSLR